MLGVVVMMVRSVCMYSMVVMVMMRWRLVWGGIGRETKRVEWAWLDGIWVFGDVVVVVMMAV